MVSLKSSLALLESYIDKNNKELVRFRKGDTAQKSEIKKLTKLADEQKNELLLHKSTNDNHRAVLSQSLSDTEPVNDSIVLELQSIKRQIVKSLSSLVPTASRESGASDDDDFVTANHRRPKSTRELSSRSPVAVSFPRAVIPNDAAA